MFQVAAYIRLKEGSSVTANSVQAYAKSRLAYYKVPKFVKFVDSYPLTVTGKIQKFELRNQSVNDFDLDI